MCYVGFKEALYFNGTDDLRVRGIARSASALDVVRREGSILVGPNRFIG